MKAILVIATMSLLGIGCARAPTPQSSFTPPTEPPPQAAPVVPPPPVPMVSPPTAPAPAPTPPRAPPPRGEEEPPAPAPPPVPEPAPPPPPPPPAPAPPASPPAESHSIEADDSGFYPSSTVTVKKGAIVRITFRVRTTNVYYNGLDVRSSEFQTGTILPGASKTVEFAATESFTFTSYWPASGVRKASGQVIVQ